MNSSPVSPQQRFERLSRESLIVDMVHPGIGGAAIYDHLDPALLRGLGTEHDMLALYRAFLLPYEAAIGDKSQIVREWWDKSGITIASYSITDLTPAGLAWTMDPLLRLCRECSWLSIATTAAEMRRAKEAGHHAFFGYSQPMQGIPNDLSRIEAAYAIGLRVLMLTYNRMDYVGCGCVERIDAGLSLYGLDVVRNCNELGILIDTSHCGNQTTLDACRHSKSPVCAVHTGAFALYAHVRNKSDEVLKAIADTGGMVGVYLLPSGLSPLEHVTLDTALDHLDYIADLIGWRHVGIGTDWPIQAPRDVLARTLGGMGSLLGYQAERHIAEVMRTLDGFTDFRRFPVVVHGLIDRGYTDEQIRGILGENFLRVFAAVCG